MGELPAEIEADFKGFQKLDDLMMSTDIRKATVDIDEIEFTCEEFADPEPVSNRAEKAQESGNSHSAVHQPVTNVIEPHDASLLQAQAEWDAVQTITPGIADEGSSTTATVVSSAPLITFSEALQYFQSTDLTALKSQIKTHVERRGLSAFIYLIIGPPRLHKSLSEEQQLAFCIAACQLENGIPVHIRTLQTVYRTLTGTRFDCSRYGIHWEDIGFQGADPATDLRGTGLLGLMHLLYLVTNPNTLPLARDLYTLSHDESQNFPFSVMSINVSRIALQSLRSGCLNRECNRRKQVISVLNDVYVGSFLRLYRIWKQEGKTISDSGFVLKDLEEYVRKQPRLVLKQLQEYVSKQCALQQSGADMSSDTKSPDLHNLSQSAK